MGDSSSLSSSSSSSSSSSLSAASESIIKALVSRGWCIGVLEQVQALILIQSALHGNSCTVDLVESELKNMDLRSIGGKSLPDPSLLRKSSILQAPKVLQISSVRDISQGSIADHSGNSSHRRMLRLTLTDGHAEITAIEYSHIPSIADDIIPGTKVRLENKVVVRSGIVCLNPKAITVIGGVVQSLHEEWQMIKKYAVFSHSSLRTSKESNAGGPPPFEKLQVGELSRQGPQGRYSKHSGSTSKSYDPTVPAKDGNSESRQINRLHNFNSRADGMDNNVKPASVAVRTEEKPSSSEARPKEVVESVPVQNQAAAQKLLQKMSEPNRYNGHSRGRKYRGKGKEEESEVFTLDEFERRKAGANPLMREKLPNVSQDEDLAWQLQKQFDLEDLQIPRRSQDSEAENIKKSMFTFQRDDAGDHGRAGFRGRGRGRGRARERGRGRGGRG